MSRLSLPQLVCTGLLAYSVAARAGDVAGVLNNYDWRGLHSALMSSEGMVGVVNQDAISMSQLRELVSSQENEARKALKGTELDEKIGEIEAIAVNELVDRVLILQEFKVQGRAIPEASMNERIQQIIDNKFASDRPTFLHWVESEGYTLKRFRERPRDDLIVEQMRKQAVEGTTSATEAKQKENEWLQGLRKKAYIKIY